MQNGIESNQNEIATFQIRQESHQNGIETFQIRKGSNQNGDETFQRNDAILHHFVPPKQ
jgi:hypothetical protein